MTPPSSFRKTPAVSRRDDAAVGLSAGALARGRRMDSKNASDEVRLARAGKAALRRNAEFRHIIVSKRDAFVCAFGSVGGMNEPEIDLGSGRQDEVPHGREEVVGGACQRHRYM